MDRRLLLSDRARRPALVLVVLAFVVIVVLGTHYAHHDLPGQLDRRLDTSIATWLRPGRPVARVLISLGNPPEAALLIALVAGAAAVARLWSGVLLTVIGTLGAVTITEVILKPLIDRRSGGALSYPSGHTTAVVAIALAIAILLTGTRRPGALVLRLLSSLAALAVAGGAAISLVAEQIHYATDTIAGICVALATVLTVALTLDALTSRRRPAGAAPAGRKSRA
jgi:undecaprenyl-diphosphatase